MLPNFLVIGALKGGTTSLYEYLRAHPDVFMSEPKELRFFVEQHNWGEGLAWYERHFDAAGNATAVGEASPAYTIRTSFPGVPARIGGVIPRAKLIYVMRHPIDRMKSHYLQRLIDGTETRPAERAFLEDLDYLHTSRYAFQLEEYLERFPREQILLLVSEDLRDRREQTIRRAFDFLGVDPTAVPDALAGEHNVSARQTVPVLPVARARRNPVYRAVARLAPAPVRRWYGGLTRRALTIDQIALSPSLEARIADALRPDIEQLRALMDDGFDGWGLG